MSHCKESIFPHEMSYADYEEGVLQLIEDEFGKKTNPQELLKDPRLKDSRNRLWIEAYLETKW